MVGKRVRGVCCIPFGLIALWRLVLSHRLEPSTQENPHEYGAFEEGAFYSY